jgi:F-type H+-transporting ATPase subunit alpha
MTDLFYQGVRPAVNVGLSVSRVGGNAQIKAMKQVAGRLRIDLAQFREMEAFARFGTEVDEATQKQLERGKRLVEILKQEQYAPMRISKQVILYFAGVNGFLDSLPVEKIRGFEKKLLSGLDLEEKDLLAEIEQKKELTDDIKKKITDVINRFKEAFSSAK